MFISFKNKKRQMKIIPLLRNIGFVKKFTYLI